MSTQGVIDAAVAYRDEEVGALVDWIADKFNIDVTKSMCLEYLNSRVSETPRSRKLLSTSTSSVSKPAPASGARRVLGSAAPKTIEKPRCDYDVPSTNDKCKLSANEGSKYCTRHSKLMNGDATVASPKAPTTSKSVSGAIKRTNLAKKAPVTHPDSEDEKAIEYEALPIEDAEGWFVHTAGIVYNQVGDEQYATGVMDAVTKEMTPLTEKDKGHVRNYGMHVAEPETDNILGPYTITPSPSEKITVNSLRQFQKPAVESAAKTIRSQPTTTQTTLRTVRRTPTATPAATAPQEPTPPTTSTQSRLSVKTLTKSEPIAPTTTTTATQSSNGEASNGVVRRRLLSSNIKKVEPTAVAEPVTKPVTPPQQDDGEGIEETDINV